MEAKAATKPPSSGAISTPNGDCNPTQKASGLFSLSLEVRLKIYECHFANAFIEVTSQEGTKTKWDRIYPKKYTFNTNVSQLTPFLLTCKQIQLEAGPVLPKSTHIHIGWNYVETDDLPPLLRDYFLPHVQSVSISCACPHFDITKLPNLKHLEVTRDPMLYAKKHTIKNCSIDELSKVPFGGFDAIFIDHWKFQFHRWLSHHAAKHGSTPPAKTKAPKSPGFCLWRHLARKPERKFTLTLTADVDIKLVCARRKGPQPILAVSFDAELTFEYDTNEVTDREVTAPPNMELVDANDAYYWLYGFFSATGALDGEGHGDENGTAVEDQGGDGDTEPPSEDEGGE